MKKILIILAILAAAANGPEAVFDKTVHDFGKVTLKDGALSCTFTVTNGGDNDLIIESVVSSCGCTDVKWTRSAITPGSSGIIEATYSNDEGPYPFDKTLTVYTSDKSRPTVLHIRGTVRKK